MWRQRARELLDSGSALMERWEQAIDCDPPEPIEPLGHHGTALMLLAMAFECLFKARALDQQMVLARGGRYIKVPGVKSHDLVGLAKKLEFDISPHEERVLHRLACWITSGRYPIQRQWTDQTRLMPNGRVYPLSVWLPEWDEVCERLLERLCAGAPRDIGSDGAPSSVC